MTAVEADIEAESAGLRVRISGSGNVLTCQLEGNPAGILRTLRRSREILSAARTLALLLARGGIRLEVVIGRVRVARAGSGVEPNTAARLLRLPATHLG